jgi:flavorubredoxin
MYGRDKNKPSNIIDTNQYIIRTAKRCLVLDPGGVELFAPMLAAVLHHAPVEEITDLFASHQDPDIISSLGLWDQALPHAKLHAPALWEGFLRHFGCETIEYVGIPDNPITLCLVRGHPTLMKKAHFFNMCIKIINKNGSAIFF